MKIFNTLTNQKEDFIPLEPGKVSIYACGPTVYNYFHVGNARPLIMFDVLRRYFQYRGYDVNFVQNFTDVDDKIINRAREEGCDSSEIAERFIEEYWTDARGLGVREANIHPKATENIPQMIDMISSLIDKGLAYQNGGDVYYRIEKFPDYGKLSNQPLEDLLAGARIDPAEIKENPMDFALWKAAKPDEPYWESPWGNGRPGWHIECSAMALRYIGKTVDIHCGGQDLVFPHHENEIAQSEGYSGEKFVRYWMHNGFISIDSKKMSKSLGNFFTVREAAKQYGYSSIRMFMLMSHYKSPLNYSGDVLQASKNALTRLKTCKENLEFIRDNGAQTVSETEKEFISQLEKYKQRYIEAMDDDFNTADAIAVIFELVRESNSLAAAPEASKTFAARSLEMLYELTDILGLLYDENKDDCGNSALEAEVESLIEARATARKDKNWAKADEIRDKLNEMGIILEDTPLGVKWKKA